MLWGRLLLRPTLPRHLVRAPKLAHRIHLHHFDVASLGVWNVIARSVACPRGQFSSRDCASSASSGYGCCQTIVPGSVYEPYYSSTGTCNAESDYILYDTSIWSPYSSLFEATYGCVAAAYALSILSSYSNPATYTIPDDQEIYNCGLPRGCYYKPSIGKLYYNRCGSGSSSLSDRRSLCLRSVCGGGVTEYTSADGRSFTGTYGNHASCTWKLRCPSDQAVRLRFTAFDMESNFDYVYMYDGPTTSYALLQRSTGSSIPLIQLSSQRYMTVRLTSDGSQVRNGFLATYSCYYPAVSTCGQGQKLSSGSCYSCSTGQYRPESSHAYSFCRNCESGKYQSSVGSSSCINCGSGRYNQNSASTQSSSCRQCTAGQYQGSTGQSSCRNCAAGQFQSNWGQTSCMSCASGRTSSSGATSCYTLYCNSGQYVSVNSWCAQLLANPRVRSLQVPSNSVYMIM